MIKAITRRTTRPAIRPANCDGERSPMLFEAGDVPKIGAEMMIRETIFLY